MTQPTMLKNGQTNSRAGWLATICGFDHRSLAIFRIALGLLVIADVVFRWQAITEMYSDEGFYTRTLSYTYYDELGGYGWSTFFWSLYWISGSVEWVTTLFIVTAILGGLLCIGCGTRVATVLLFVLTVSLHYRNPLVVTSGDLFLKTLILWSIFLPLGRVWSWDARRTKTDPNQLRPFASVATLGLLVQLTILYLGPGLAKQNEIWYSGDAMSYVLRLDIYITEFGRSLLAYPLMLKLVSWATLFFETIWILTLFVPWKNDFFRWSNLVIFWGFHVGIFLAMSIGLFPIISMVGWLPLIPARFWNRASELKPQFESWTVMSNWGRLSRLVCTVILLITICWNIGNEEHPFLKKFHPHVLSRVVYRFGLDQHFRMFDKPPKLNPWFVYDAVLEDGSKVDLMTGNPSTTERPDWIRKTFPSFHWRKFHRNLTNFQSQRMRQELANYFFRKWNEEHPPEKQATRLRLILHMEEVGPNYNQKDRESQVWASIGRQQRKPGSVFDSLRNSESENGLPF